MTTSYSPTYITEHAEEHGEREDEPVFKLVDAAVALGHPDDCPVIEGRDENRKDGPNETS